MASVLLLGIAAHPHRAAAQTGSAADSAVEEDADLRERNLATQLFKEERYEESLQHWLRAYELAPLPRLHYNIARCYQKLNRPKDELRLLELFTASDPDRATAPEKHQVAEKRIAELRTQLGLNRRESTPVHKRWWFWTLLGTAVAGTAAGVTAAVVGGGASPAAGDGLPDPAVVRRSALSIQAHW